jgi:calcineurin-like phosphoesterase family protein
MLRLVQTSDVHLGARHPSLGERAADQRARQLEAFERVVELALATPADLLLIAGDLFDTSVQSRGLVERVGTILRKLVAAGIPIVLVPGRGDAPGRASIYHAHDLSGLVGDGPGAGSLTILTAEAPDVIIPSLGARISSRFPANGLPDDGWRIGLIHRETRPRDDEIASAGVDYLAIGGPHSAATGRAANVSWGASGAPELVDVQTDTAGEALVVTLDEASAQPATRRERVGRTRFERLDLDLPRLVDQAGLVRALAAKADPDLVLDVRLTGDWPDSVEIDPGDAESALAARFLRLNIRNEARATLTTGALPPSDTIAGAFLRDLETRIADAEASGNSDATAELREALRLGRRLLAGRSAAG